MQKLYFSNSREGCTLVTNTSKFFTLYTTSLALIKNIFFYKIKLVFFGTPLFKHEIRSFNVLLYKNTTYNTPFSASYLLLGVLPFIRNSLNSKLLQSLSQMNINTSFIGDIFYHKTAITYLRKVGILTTGLVPITSNALSVDIAIPLPTDSIFLQIFMFKVLICIKHFAEYSRYMNMLTVFKKNNL